MIESPAKVFIADVLYTRSDETFYVLDRYSYQSLYQGDRLEDVIAHLKTDGWARCGSVNRVDGVVVALWSRGSDYLAIWD
jgi:hypothetical protein